MLRELRTLLADEKLDESLSPREVLGHARRRIEAELPGDRPFARMTPELIRRIAERFAASNREFVRECLGGRDAGLFTPPETPRVQPVEWSLLDADECERRVFTRVVEDSLAEARARMGKRQARERRLASS